MAISCSSDDSSGNNGDDGPGVNNCALSELTAGETKNFNNPCAIAVSPSGMVAVSAYNGFDIDYAILADVKVALSYEDYKAGNYVASLQAISPEAMAFDDDDNLYIAETEGVAGITIYKKAANNNYNYFKTIQNNFVNPRGLAIDDQNRLYMANDGTGKILRFDDPLNSNGFEIVGNYNEGIKGVAIKGNIMYVTNFTTNYVTRSRLNDDGSLDELVGGVTVSHATDISVRGNKVIVTSYADSSITVFSDCEFTNENKTVYNNLGKIFGTAFISDTKILAASHDANYTMVIELN